MVYYIATLYIRPGGEAAVAAAYESMEPLLRAAPGFRQRTVYQSRPGAYHEAMLGSRAERSAEQHHHNHHPGLDEEPEPVQLVIIEAWDSAEDRVRFTREAAFHLLQAELAPLIDPDTTEAMFDKIVAEQRG